MNRGEFCRSVLLFACVVPGCIVAGLALGCADGYYPSVHFNTLEPDFGRPPRPFSIAEWGEDEYRPMGCVPRDSQRWREACERRERWDAIGVAALANARRDESAGNFRESIEHYRNAIKHGAGEIAAVRDRAEILSELTRALDRGLLNEYLSARRDYEFSRLKLAESRMEKLAADPRAGVLRAHALYVLGAIRYDRGEFAGAAKLFERLAALYPTSPRREAALIMIPRSLLRSPLPKERYPETWVDRPLPNRSSITRSAKAIHALLRYYPRSRFRPDALGWLARADYVQGRRVEALESYLRQYETLPRAYRTSAAASIYFVSRKLTKPDAKRLRSDLIRDSALLTAYLDYRIYHGLDRHRDFPQLADLATEAAKRARIRLASGVAARLAEIQYLRGRYPDAITWANRARCASGREGKDLALYVRGASRAKRGQRRSAERDFEKLLRQYPDSHLCGAARENLALLCERRGRPDLALDHYFALNYPEDIAYLLDVRMATRQVAAYLRSRPGHSKRNLLVYTLGIRQLRDNDLSGAARTLSRLKDQAVLEMMVRGKGDWWRSIHTQPRDPRKTARDLAHLERAVRRARKAHAKANAMYALATYTYKNRDLMFYNAALWQGDRNIAFSWRWNDSVATRGDNLSVREHHHEHECLYRVRELCLKIAQRYPDSPAAPKALYRAACATHYLASFNDWWRKEADRLDFWAQSVRLMKRVYEKYPHDPLAKSARKFAKVFKTGYTEAERNGVFEVARSPQHAKPEDSAVSRRP